MLYKILPLLVILSVSLWVLALGFGKIALNKHDDSVSGEELALFRKNARMGGYCLIIVSAIGILNLFY